MESGNRVKAFQKLVEKFQGLIDQGVYKPGQPMPKRDYLAKTEKVSYSTIAAAYKCLIKSKHVHRQGNKVIVGPGLPLPSQSKKSNPACIFFVMPRAGVINSYREDKRVKKFFSEFETQAVHYQVRVIRCIMEKSPDLPFGTINSIHAMVKKAKSLGFQYLGALVLSQNDPIKNFETWMIRLAKLNNPVIWLDKNNIGWEHCKSDKVILEPKLAHNFVRAFSNEEEACHLALQYLSSMGHRKIAYPFMEHEEWQKRRYERLQRLKPKEVSLTCHTGIHRSNWFENPQELIDKLNKLYHSDWKFFKVAIETIQNETSFKGPGLLNATEKALYGKYASIVNWNRYSIQEPDALPGHIKRLLDHLKTASRLIEAVKTGATALLAPNDSWGEQMGKVLHRIGIRIPEEISILGFDNSEDESFQILNSVDFGFGVLGYQSFYVISEFIPIKLNRKRELSATPKIVDKDSVKRLA